MIVLVLHFPLWGFQCFPVVPHIRLSLQNGSVLPSVPLQRLSPVHINRNFKDALTSDSFHYCSVKNTLRDFGSDNVAAFSGLLGNQPWGYGFINSHTEVERV